MVDGKSMSSTAFNCIPSWEQIWHGFALFHFMPWSAAIKDTAKFWRWLRLWLLGCTPPWWWTVFVLFGFHFCVCLLGFKDFCVCLLSFKDFCVCLLDFKGFFVFVRRIWVGNEKRFHPHRVNWSKLQGERREEIVPFHQLESSAGVFLTVPGTDISFEGRIRIW